MITPFAAIGELDAELLPDHTVELEKKAAVAVDRRTAFAQLGGSIEKQAATQSNYKGGLQRLGDGIWNYTAKPIGNAIGGVVKGVGSAIGNAVKGVGNLVGGGVRTLWNGVTAVPKAIAGAASGAVGGLFHGGLGGAMQGAWDGGTNSLTTDLKDMWGGVQQAGNGLFGKPGSSWLPPAAASGQIRQGAPGVATPPATSGAVPPMIARPDPSFNSLAPKSASAFAALGYDDMEKEAGIVTTASNAIKGLRSWMKSRTAAKATAPSGGYDKGVGFPQNTAAFNGGVPPQLPPGVPAGWRPPAPSGGMAPPPPPMAPTPPQFHKGAAAFKELEKEALLKTLGKGINWAGKKLRSSGAKAKDDFSNVAPMGQNRLDLGANLRRLGTSMQGINPRVAAGVDGGLAGLAVGRLGGHAAGKEKGHTEGFNEGSRSGSRSGLAQGLEKGYRSGIATGVTQAHDSMRGSNFIERLKHLFTGYKPDTGKTIADINGRSRIMLGPGGMKA